MVQEQRGGGGCGRTEAWGQGHLRYVPGNTRHALVARLVWLELGVWAGEESGARLERCLRPRRGSCDDLRRSVGITSATGGLGVSPERRTQEPRKHGCWERGSNSLRAGRRGVSASLPLKVGALSSGPGPAFHSDTGACVGRIAAQTPRLWEHVRESIAGATLSTQVITDCATAGGLAVQVARAGLLAAEVPYVLRRPIKCCANG